MECIRAALGVRLATVRNAHRSLRLVPSALGTRSLREHHAGLNDRSAAITPPLSFATNFISYFLNYIYNLFENFPLICYTAAVKNDFTSKQVTLTKAAELLSSGAVGVIPTDTVYGLAANATNEAAVTRLYRLKNRERKPGTLIAASVAQLEILGINQDSLSLASPYWPGPLSVVLPYTDRAYLTQGVGSLAIRVVADPQVRTLLSKTGPLITSSANQPGEPESKNIQEAMDYFGDTVDFYVDGGDRSGRLASTIVKITSDGLEVLRQGAIHL